MLAALAVLLAVYQVALSPRVARLELATVLRPGNLGRVPGQPYEVEFASVAAAVAVAAVELAE
jgi:hypothetical protein